MSGFAYSLEWYQNVTLESISNVIAFDSENNQFNMTWHLHGSYTMVHMKVVLFLYIQTYLLLDKQN